MFCIQRGRESLAHDPASVVVEFEVLQSCFSRSDLRYGSQVVQGVTPASSSCVDVLPFGMELLFYFLGCWLVPVITEFTDYLLLNCGRAPDPLRGRGEMAMSPPRRACLFSLHGGGFVYVAQSFPQNADVQCVFQRSLWERRSASEGATTRTGASVSRVRTSPVDVPAASWECWNHCVDSQAGTPSQGRSTPNTGGRLTQVPSAHQPQNWTGSRFF